MGRLVRHQWRVQRPGVREHFVTQSNDATAGSWSRLASTDGHTETIAVNNPRSGYIHRAAATATNSSGGAVNVIEFYGLSLRGMGMTGLWMPTLNTTGGFFFSVNKTGGTGNANLPANLLGRAYAKTCAALRSGVYRVVQPRMGASASGIVTLTVNASTLGWTNSAGSSGTWVPSATEACRFNDQGTGLNDIVVSQAGVIVLRNNFGGTYQLNLGFPEQAHTLAELAGDWNAIGLEINSTGTGYNGISATLTVDANGLPTAAIWCEDEAGRSVSGTACQTLTPAVGAWAVDAGGGFSRTTGERLFVYTSGTGSMAMQVDPDGSFKLFAPKRKLAGMGNLLNRVWGIANDSNMSSGTAAGGALGLSSFTQKSLDPTTLVLTRTNNDDGHTELLTFNSPRDGFVYRPSATGTTTIATATLPLGSTVNVREFTSLTMRDTMGISPLWVPGLDFTPQLGRLQISVSTP